MDRKFRGKRVDNEEWVYFNQYGAYVDKNGNEISPKRFIRDCGHKITPETEGQFTGLHDKNGMEIYEGDIIKSHYANAIIKDHIESVVFHNGKFAAERKIGASGHMWALLADGIPHISQDKSVYMKSCEVIGNIHDNPELLEGPAPCQSDT